jgi:hypothetical protein
VPPQDEQAPDELLASITRRTDTYEAMRAIARLGELRFAAAAPLLIEVLTEWGDDWLRIEAAKALGRIRDPRAVPGLLEALRADFGERYANLVVDQQSEIPEDKIAHAAVAAVQDLLDQEELQRESARALVAVGGDEVLAALAALLDELTAATERGFTGDDLIATVTKSIEQLREPSA